MNVSKISLKRTLLAVALVGLVLALALVFYIGLSSLIQNDSSTNTVTVQRPAKVEVPARLKIPKIQVDAAVEQVGLTPDGAMDTPKGAVNTAWYNRGPHPGETGSAVIDGHFDSETGAPAVFNNLSALQKGDKLSVEDASGKVITFVVRESRRYDPAADATAVFKSKDGIAHLNLITCAGTWNTAQQSYSNRLVVFADKE